VNGLPALEKVFWGEFINAEAKGFSFSGSKKVLAKVSRRLKKEVASALRAIFYA